MMRFALKGCILMAACSYAVNVNAASFLLESQINGRISYDDNINSSKDSKQTSSVVTLTPKAKLTYKSDSWDTTMNASVSGTSYSSDFRGDQIYSHLDLGTAYKDQRNIYSLTTGYNKTSNLAADEDIITLVTDDTDTEKLTFAPKYTRLITERASLSLTYAYADVAYTPNSLGTYLPYETQTATGEVTYKLSQRNELSVSVAATDYTSENNISEYLLLSSRIGFTHNVSELVNSHFFVGANTRDFTTRSSQNFTFGGSLVTGSQAVETSSAGGIYGVSVDAGWIALNASRDTLANSFGGIDETDLLSAVLRMQVTSLVGITLTVERKSIDEINESVIDKSRTYTMVAPAIKLALAHNLNLRAEYFFVHQEQTSDPQTTSDKNRLTLNLTYNFPSI